MVDFAAFIVNIILVGWWGGVVCGWETKKKVGLLCLLVKFGFSSFEPPDFNTRGLVIHLICVQKVLSIPLLFMGHFMVLPSPNLKWHIIN